VRRRRRRRRRRAELNPIRLKIGRKLL